MPFTGIGTWEMLLIAMIVLIVFGPRRLPEISRSMGKALREFKRGMNEIQRELEVAERETKWSDKSPGTSPGSGFKPPGSVSDSETGSTSEPGPAPEPRSASEPGSASKPGSEPQAEYTIAPPFPAVGAATAGTAAAAAVEATTSDVTAPEGESTAATESTMESATEAEMDPTPDILTAWDEASGAPPPPAEQPEAVGREPEVAGEESPNDEPDADSRSETQSDLFDS